MGAFERVTLANGLRVLAAPLPAARSVAVVVGVAAGSRYERADNRGIAHFAEHMLFNGTERRPTQRAISTELASVGARHNATTNREDTRFFVRCAADQLDVALDVLVDMIGNSLFDEAEIEREKKVIVEEINMYNDTPSDLAGILYSELVLGDNPLGWDTLGTPETVRAASRRTFREYLDGCYTPDRLVVGVAGPLTAAALVPKVEALLGDLEGVSTVQFEPAAISTDGPPRVVFRERAGDQAALMVGVPSLPLGHPDRYALQVLTTILGSGMSSRLFAEVRMKRGLAYTIQATNTGFTDTGTLYVEAGVNPSRVEEAVETIVRELRSICEERAPEDELSKAKNLAKGSFVLGTESPQGLIWFGLRGELLEGRATEPDALLDGIEAVTAEDVRRVAEATIGASPLALAVVGPAADPERLAELLA